MTVGWIFTSSERSVDRRASNVHRTHRWSSCIWAKGWSMGGSVKPLRQKVITFHFSPRNPRSFTDY